MKNRKMMKLSAGLFSAVMLLGSMPSVTILADTPDFGWYEENGGRYWYENGIRQGTEGRGKEIYDPSTDAWYWLDAVDNGKVAAGKDVYQESWAGDYADRGDGTGKWVRYDENGRMIKGWSTTDAGTYYFDPATGAMAKGTAKIDGKFCAFDPATGVGIHCQWYEVNGNKYWYEGGVRQGTEGRGKEIFDPASNAWYWLDAVDNGKMATGKDVYQESSGGKWVRYDAEGHMIKGWNEQNGKKYYFDPVTGAMSKGIVTIDGTQYYFDEKTGVLDEGFNYILRIVELVNQERKKEGLEPLTLQAEVTEAAQVRAREIATSFSHTRPDGSRCWSALKDAGASYRGAGENIAAGQRTPEAAMESWMGSQGHRANILNEKFTHIGVGYYQNASGVRYWCQMFTY